MGRKGKIVEIPMVSGAHFSFSKMGTKREKPLKLLKFQHFLLPTFHFQKWAFTLKNGRKTDIKCLLPTFFQQKWARVFVEISTFLSPPPTFTPKNRKIIWKTAFFVHFKLRFYMLPHIPSHIQVQIWTETVKHT